MKKNPFIWLIIFQPPLLLSIMSAIWYQHLDSDYLSFMILGLELLVTYTIIAICSAKRASLQLPSVYLFGNQVASVVMMVCGIVEESNFYIIYGLVSWILHIVLFIRFVRLGKELPYLVFDEQSKLDQAQPLDTPCKVHIYRVSGHKIYINARNRLQTDKKVPLHIPVDMEIDKDRFLISSVGGDGTNTTAVVDTNGRDEINMIYNESTGWQDASQDELDSYLRHSKKPQFEKRGYRVLCVLMMLVAINILFYNQYYFGQFASGGLHWGKLSQTQFFYATILNFASCIFFMACCFFTFKGKKLGGKLSIAYAVFSLIDGIAWTVIKSDALGYFVELWFFAFSIGLLILFFSTFKHRKYFI